MERLTTGEVATLLGITPSGVRMAIKAGRITPLEQIGKFNIISLDEVERYRANHLGRKGRPKEKRE